VNNIFPANQLSYHVFKIEPFKKNPLHFSQFNVTPQYGYQPTGCVTGIRFPAETGIFL